MTWSRRNLLVSALSVATVSGSGGASLPLARRVVLGARTGSLPYPDLSSFYALERRSGAALREMSWFLEWNVSWKGAAAADAAAHGKELLIGWSAQQGRVPVPLAEIARGQHDRYVTEFLTAAGQYPSPVRIRPFHEMNGNWYPWSLAQPRAAVTSSGEWIAAWRHLVEIGRDVAPQVQWVWCVNQQDVGGVALERYYPGDEYVDVLGIDAYNGFGRPGERWIGPVPLLEPVYRRLSRLNHRAPMAICELGCREARPGEHRDKAAWIRELLGQIRFPRIDRISFFSKDRWALDTSPAALAALRAASD